MIVAFRLAYSSSSLLDDLCYDAQLDECQVSLLQTGPLLGVGHIDTASWHVAIVSSLSSRHDFSICPWSSSGG